MSIGFAGMSRGDAFRQRSWRRLTIVISIVVHAAAAAAAIAYSFWHVEEISPPTVTVTFVSAAAAPPPPPPPPPLGGGGAPKRPRVARPKADATPARPTPEAPHTVETPEKVPVVEAPKEKPGPVTSSVAPEGAGDGHVSAKNGVAGGVKGGVAGGVVGGVVGAAPHVAPKFLPPQMGAQLKLSGAEPDFPTALRRAGASYVVMAKICVNVGGAVDSVTIQKHADPSLDANVASAVKGWHFRPATANGMPVPFCYFGRFEFKSD